MTVLKGKNCIESLNIEKLGEKILRENLIQGGLCNPFLCQYIHICVYV